VDMDIWFGIEFGILPIPSLEEVSPQVFMIIRNGGK
jgi:hypothetical protein